MITSAAANNLRKLIETRCKAEREDAFAGSQRPEDAEIIRLELKNAKLMLDRFVEELTARAT